jgi:uncharacterized protein (TIGR02679 family)
VALSDLDRLWEAAAARLERNGLAPRGVIVLDGLSREERHALTGLIGRRVDSRARIDLAVVDARLRETGVATGLVATVEARRGALVDKPGARAAKAASRAQLWSAVRGALASAGLDAEPWVEEWVESIRPVVGRLAFGRAQSVATTAVRCVARLPWSSPGVGRTELASAVAGSSHALDDGSVLGALVLRAIAARLGTPLPSSAAERRQLWSQGGVLSDEVSTTVLTRGLQPAGTSPVARSVSARSDAGCEAHLTLRDLARLDRLVAPGTPVSVCENPRVLEAAMDRGSPAVVVCTAGNPTVVVTALLSRLVSDGAALRYHGDFDWPGVAIANRVIGVSGATAWRMGAADYEDALAAAGTSVVELLPLEGRPAAAIWDAELTASMERAGVAVHEEAVLDVLVADLL